MSIVVGGRLVHILNQVAVFFLVILFNGIRGEDCSVEAFEKCTAPLTIISSVSGMSMITQRQELDELCPQFYEGIICLRSYTRRCMSLGQRSHFLKLFHGSTQLVKELCTESPFQNDFLKHSSCLSLPSIIDDYNKCATDYRNALMLVQTQEQQIEVRNNNRTSNLVCCSIQEYVQCSESVVYKQCGLETASFTRKLLSQMTVTMISEYCGPNTENHCEAKNTGHRIAQSIGLLYLVLVAKWVLSAPGQ